MKDFRPSIRVLYRGNLIALTGASGVIVYSTHIGNKLLGCSSSSRGHSLSQYLKSSTEKEYFNTFLNQLHEVNFDMKSSDTCTVRTRCDIPIVIQSNNIVMHKCIQQNIIKKDMENDCQNSLLAVTYGTSFDEMSFSDAFEYAAVEWMPEQPSLYSRSTSVRVR